jgi:hypothetical protein
MLATSSDSMNYRHVESGRARRFATFKKGNGLLDGSNVNKILHAGQFALVSVVSKNETFWPGWDMLTK